MPASFIIDPAHRVVVSTGSGTFTQADFHAHMARIGADARFNPDFNHIIDCRAISQIDLTREQIMDLATRSIFNAQSRRAFVVSSELQFGLTRMFAAYREIAGGQKIMIFRSMAEALAWLELPADFEPAPTARA
jgi:hypothetical protein